MKIAIDAHALGTQAGGNETYMRELLLALREHPTEHEIVALVHGHASPADSGGWPTVKLPGASSYLRVPVVLPWTTWRCGANLLHVQYNAPPWSPCPYVVSVHDVGWIRHPELFKPIVRKRLEALTPRSVRRARRVFALTHAMRNELSEAYSIPAERIDVVAPGVSPAFRVGIPEETVRAVLQKHGVRCPYVLYIGTLQPRKNLVRLAQAFARLKGATYTLVLAGARGWQYDEILKELQSAKLGDRLMLIGYVADGDLPALIAGASMFAYVSIYEGFGLPVLEALACGTPVVTSAVPAIQEVAGDAAICCDPLDVDSITDALQRASESTTAARLRADGPVRASRFSREAMAAAATAGYDRVLLS